MEYLARICAHLLPIHLDTSDLFVTQTFFSYVRDLFEETINQF